VQAQVLSGLENNRTKQTLLLLRPGMALLLACFRKVAFALVDYPYSTDATRLLTE